MLLFQSGGPFLVGADHGSDAVPDAKGGDSRGKDGDGRDGEAVSQGDGMSAATSFDAPVPMLVRDDPEMLDLTLGLLLRYDPP